MESSRLAILLACFSDRKAAGQAHGDLEREVRARGQTVLDTVVLKIDRDHRARVHDPRRVVLGTVTPAITWGLFGLVANGWIGLLIWGVLGALCGLPYTYSSIHHATKAELRHVGAALPADSSALLTFVSTADPAALGSAAAVRTAASVGVAAIADDLSVQEFDVSAGAARSAHAADPGPGAGKAIASMVLVRYPDVDGAHAAAARLTADHEAAKAAQVELVVRRDKEGRSHVADPKFGVAAFITSDIVTWGVFGVAVGAISGAVGGGILKGGLITGIAWAVFGIFAGALYGLWAGRAVSGRRLRCVGGLLPAGTSAVLAWTDGRPEGRVLDDLTGLATEHAILTFTPVPGGALVRGGGL